MWIEVPYYDNLPRVERSRLARALWIEVTVSGALCRKRCRGSREPCGSKSNQFNPHNNVSRRGSREPCGSKFPSFSNDVHPPVEARESLVDRRVQRSPLLYFFHSRGSREPCGSKVSFSILPVLTGRRGSREPCGSKVFYIFTHDISARRRGSREPCGSKDLPQCFHVTNFVSRLARALWIEGWSSVVTVIFNRVEARESLVDRRLPNSPLYQCDYRRGSREPCGSKEPLFYKQKRGLPSRLARALWIEGHGNTIRNAGQWVEARESLVDRRKGRSAEPSLYARRGSREPCGSKAPKLLA